MKRLHWQELVMNDGLDAALKGEDKNSNPYPKDNLHYKWWYLGWLECHHSDFGINKNKENK